MHVCAGHVPLETEGPVVRSMDLGKFRFNYVSKNMSQLMLCTPIIT